VSGPVAIAPAELSIVRQPGLLGAGTQGLLKLACQLVRTYVRSVSFPKPIRYDIDTWLVMRTDPVLPKAAIQRLRGKDGSDRYLLIRWDIDPVRRALMGVYDTLEKANEMVLYDNGQHGPSGPPNGRTGAG
jgi:hypothetical protein